MSTIFGGDTGLTYDDVQRRRKMADSLRQQYSTMPRSIGEGVNAIAKALVARGVDRQASAAETKLRAESDALWQGLFGGTPSYSAPTTTGTDVSAITSPTPVGSGSLDGVAGAEAIRAGLIERGLPEHVADGFILNFQDESALNTGLNEREPIVPGSRGGYGLAQWTGPRRVALETFAQMRGKPVSDLDTQLDFLMTELQGDEARAAGLIMGTQDPGSAAAAIATHFLRPAKEHLDRRVARYTGAPQVVSTQSAPQPSPSGGFGGNMQGIIAALGNPYIRQDPGKVAVLQALLQRQLAPPTPRSTQYVDGLGLIDSQTGEIINDFGGAGAGEEIDVQSSVILDDGTAVMVTESGERIVRGADGTLLEGEAARDAIREAREFTVNNQRDIYAGRRTGTNEAERDTGTAAAAAGEQGKQAVELSGQAYEQASALSSANSTISEAIDAIKRGGETGAFERYVPNITEASASLRNAMDRMGLDIISATTFGALSEGELKLAMETAVPRNLDTPELLEWLERKQAANSKAQAMLLNAAQFLGTPGNTLQMWIEQNQSQPNIKEMSDEDFLLWLENN